MVFADKTCATAVIAILVAAMSVLPGCGDESPVSVTKGIDEPVARTIAPGSNESQVITVEDIEGSGASVENAGGT